MFLLLFIFVLSLSVSFSLHFFVISLCVRISQPAQTALARRLLSLSPLSLRCPCVKCQTLLSGQRRRHLPYRRRQFPASPPHPLYTLHSALCPLFGRFICVGGKVSRRLVLPLVLYLFLSLLFFHTILLCYVFCLFCIICCLCLPCPALLCGSPASSAHKFYLYIFRYFPTAFVVVVHIL